jgi:ACS family pantothenate transporter-like MFS transporter
MWAMVAVSIAMAVWTALLVFMHVRTEKRREVEHTSTALAEKQDDLGVEPEKATMAA